ncbi:hypothetical protein [Sanguibacter suaedae]|uniref:Uncharacterized protein n=1 Tax=Sanguibacter suaedae TaxID=2795737 RepID=A0A934I3S4_9MICO|nr:hypothetical protein [Sanguibacter suaedae]MBI9115054.1 hypothetical protein [Sanguibacter suaedae]
MAGMSTPPRQAEGQARRGRMSPALVAFVVADVLLVLLAVWIGVSMSSGDEEEPTASQSTSASASPSPTSDPGDGDAEGTAEPAADAEAFASPSGNIVCQVSSTGASCGIVSLATEPAPVPGCDGTVGHVVEVTGDGVSVPCVGPADQPAAPPAGTQQLAYGSSLAVGPYSCDSTETGVTCTDTATGQGFTLARAGITRVG